MLKETAAAILEDSIKLKITGEEKHPWFWWKTKRVTREFEIKPLTLGSLIRISRIILGIDPEIFNKERILEALYGAADKHGTELARVVAIAFTNSRREPADSLVSFIQESITTPQLKEVLSVIILQMDVRSFMTSIVSIRGMNLLTMKTNPADQGESNSLWSTIGGWMKYFRLTWDQILWEVSYQNLLMLSATIPVYKSSREKGKKKDEIDPSINIDSGQDLANFLGLKM